MKLVIQDPREKYLEARRNSLIRTGWTTGVDSSLGNEYYRVQIGLGPSSIVTNGYHEKKNIRMEATHVKVKTANLP
jgi:hypothetical protein